MEKPKRQLQNEARLNTQFLEEGAKLTGLRPFDNRKLNQISVELSFESPEDAAFFSEHVIKTNPELFGDIKINGDKVVFDLTNDCLSKFFGGPAQMLDEISDMGRLSMNEFRIFLWEEYWARAHGLIPTLAALVETVRRSLG